MADNADHEADAPDDNAGKFLPNNARCETCLVAVALARPGLMACLSSVKPDSLRVRYFEDRCSKWREQRDPVNVSLDIATPGRRGARHRFRIK